MSKKMLSKSVMSAVIMAIVAHVAALLTVSAWLLVTGSWKELALPAGFEGAESIGAISVILLLAALSVGIVSASIYRLDDTHYGLQGAVGWAMVGVIYILMSRIISLLLPLDPFVRMLQVVLIGLAYGLVFRLVPGIFKRS